MIPRKPYEAKPMIHSPRGLEVLASVSGYLIRVIRDGSQTNVRTQDPGQCLAAMITAKERNARCLVFAIGWAYGEECLELVDDVFLLEKM